MSDSKADYSAESGRYVSSATGGSAKETDKKAFEKSKGREAKHGENWKREPVNFNEICDKFAPGARGRRRGQKFVVEGKRYVVQADMASGYVRIWDKILRKHVRLNGTPGTYKEGTHFKIKKREEM